MLKKILAIGLVVESAAVVALGAAVVAGGFDKLGDNIKNVVKPERKD